MHTVNADPASAGVNGSGVSVGPSMVWGVQAAPPSGLDVEIVIPVYNEERALAASIHRLHRFLDSQLPFSLADHDRRQRQHRRHPGDRARARRRARRRRACLRLEQKGRGRALRAAWSASRARVVAYMDVDLSTDLHASAAAARAAALRPQRGRDRVAPGPRRRGSRAAPKREFISRAYNRSSARAARAVHRRAVRVQGGARRRAARAARRGARRRLVLRHRAAGCSRSVAGLRIHEVPVDWVDDPDSRVDIVSTALADLRGVARLAARHTGGALCRRSASSRRSPTRCCSCSWPGALGSAGASAVALALTAVGNTAANRR